MEVAGEVQGVGFRHFLREHARRLGLSGWVRNLTSGNVEFAACGDEESVTELLALVRRGPDGAVVKQVIALRPLSAMELPSPFTVLK
jgi:acylphosphatase